MSRGRPSRSEIREKMTALIDRLKFSYGYEIFKHYKDIFNDATSRVIYYHLKKGAERGEFVAVNVKRVMGDYSWGDETERVYYTLGPFAITKQVWQNKVLKADIVARDIEHEWGNNISIMIKELKEAAKTVNGKEKEKLINKCDKLLSWINNKNNDKSFAQEINSIKLFLK